MLAMSVFERIRRPGGQVDMEYQVVSLNEFGVLKSHLELQGFLNGWVAAQGLEVVSVLSRDDDVWVVLRMP